MKPQFKRRIGKTRFCWSRNFYWKNRELQRKQKRDDYFQDAFDHFWSECRFWGSWSSSGIVSSMKPNLHSQACPSLHTGSGVTILLYRYAVLSLHMHRLVEALGLIHTRHFRAQYCYKKDKNILRHLTIFSNSFLLNNQGKLLSKLCIPCIRFGHWILCLKNINVFLSQYCVQKCLVCIGPKLVRLRNGGLV